MRESIRVFMCPIDGCAVIGVKGTRCPKHKLMLHGAIFRKVEMDSKPPKMDKPYPDFSELMKVMESVAKALKKKS